MDSSSVELLSSSDVPGVPDHMDRWPPSPVRVSGELKVKLFGQELASIDLDLTIRAIGHVIEAVDPRRRHRDAVGASDELEALSKAALLRRARDVDLRGRSGMSRAELIRALSR